MSLDEYQGSVHAFRAFMRMAAREQQPQEVVLMWRHPRIKFWQWVMKLATARMLRLAMKKPKRPAVVVALRRVG